MANVARHANPWLEGISVCGPAGLLYHHYLTYHGESESARDFLLSLLPSLTLPPTLPPLPSSPSPPSSSSPFPASFLTIPPPPLPSLPPPPLPSLPPSSHSLPSLLPLSLPSLLPHTPSPPSSPSPSQEALCQSYVERAIALLKSQNKVVAIHPNSHIYSQLLSIVDFDGYYLENKPCLVCNDPEVPYTVSPSL